MTPLAEHGGATVYEPKASPTTQCPRSSMVFKDRLARAALGQDSLFDDDPIIRGPKLEDVEAEALPVIARNIFDLVGARGAALDPQPTERVRGAGAQAMKWTRRQLAVAIAALKAVLEREDFKGLTAADLVGVEVVA